MSAKIATLLILAASLCTIVLSTADADIQSPLQQSRQGIPIDEIQCNDNKVLLESPKGKPICVTKNTSGKLLDRGYNIIIPVQNNNILKENTIVSDTIISDTIISDTNTSIPNETSLDVLEPTTTIMLNITSDTEFIDDKREIKRSILQRAPAPWPMYDKIINSTTGLIVPGPTGASGIQTTPHEKYSLNDKVGLYLEDWMPTYIPEGQKLLYADTNYNAFEVNERAYESHNAIYQFVPTSFVLHKGADTHDLKVSKGFTVNIKHRTLPFDSVEDGIEHAKELKESQSGNYGGYRDMTRDGKTVYAFEGGNDYNHYRTVLTFYPDENTMVSTLSYYHTLDELIPVFNSIMK